jgi:hypothetical protein
VVESDELIRQGSGQPQTITGGIGPDQNFWPTQDLNALSAQNLTRPAEGSAAEGDLPSRLANTNQAWRVAPPRFC